MNTQPEKKFIDLAEVGGTLGREDTQGCWQTTLAKYLNNCTILDVGAGLGESKKRMSIRGIEVTTYDPAPGLPVDITGDLDQIPDNSFDYVTAFDVFEHIPTPEQFLLDLKRIARRGVFLTTPNLEHTKGTHVYHFREYLPHETVAMAKDCGLHFEYGWMMFPDGPPNIRRAMLSEFESDRFCFNYGILFSK